MTENTPISDFVGFVTEGKYSFMKENEYFLTQAKAHLRKELHQLPGKRHEFKELNMVAKFVAKEVRKIDHAGLIEDLLNYVKPELALPLLTLSEKAMKEVDMADKAAIHRLPDNYYVRPFLNKVGKQTLNPREYLFGGQSIKQLVNEIRVVSTLQKRMDEEYDTIKSNLFTCSELNQKKKVSTPVGSLSLIANKTSWNMDNLYQDLGEDFLISFGQVKTGVLDEWVMSGRIPKSIITKNRKVEDIRLDFVVMALNDEERMLQTYRSQKTRMSLKYNV